MGVKDSTSNGDDFFTSEGQPLGREVKELLVGSSIHSGLDMRKIIAYIGVLLLSNNTTIETN